MIVSELARTLGGVGIALMSSLVPTQALAMSYFVTYDGVIATGSLQDMGQSHSLAGSPFRLTFNYDNMTAACDLQVCLEPAIRDGRAVQQLVVTDSVHEISITNEHLSNAGILGFGYAFGNGDFGNDARYFDLGQTIVATDSVSLDELQNEGVDNYSLLRGTTKAVATTALRSNFGNIRRSYTVDLAPDGCNAERTFCATGSINYTRDSYRFYSPDGSIYYNPAQLYRSSVIVGELAFTRARIYVDGVSSVPEPESWIAMIAGFFAIGLMQRSHVLGREHRSNDRTVPLQRSRH